MNCYYSVSSELFVVSFLRVVFLLVPAYCYKTLSVVVIRRIHLPVITFLSSDSILIESHSVRAIAIFQALW